jgi:hypothetical protein
MARLRSTRIFINSSNSAADGGVRWWHMPAQYLLISMVWLFCAWIAAPLGLVESGVTSGALLVVLHYVTKAS